ncbi:MAG: TetR/AcrR family transcriptional regulator, partial [Gemmatimonas sp.]|nr:TetR/AcrR family transcriptional regulator [Gemmatimonadaceae bacterium]
MSPKCPATRDDSSAVSNFRNRRFTFSAQACAPKLLQYSPSCIVVNFSQNRYVHAMKKRKYELKQRAERLAEVRHRILDAVVALHEELGPARTTISAIAERAGVERLTVYRHFADESSLFGACFAHFSEKVPPPNPATWSDIEDPVDRLRAALLAFYAYYERGEDMLSHVMQDAPRIPALAAVVRPWGEFVDAVRAALVKGWGVKGHARRHLAAALGHALRFESWQSLTRFEGLTRSDAADLMVALAQTAATSRGRSSARVGRSRASRST